MTVLPNEGKERLILLNKLRASRASQQQIKAIFTALNKTNPKFALEAKINNAVKYKNQSLLEGYIKQNKPTYIGLSSSLCDPILFSTWLFLLSEF